MVRGTDLPYANGIEVSADEQEFYVASSGLFTVTAYSNSNPARLLRSSKPLAFVPDNLHMGGDGKLITAGLDLLDPVCGEVSRSSKFSLEEFASCPRPFTVLAIDPQSMQGTVVATGPANKHFSNITMALPVGSELWIGSFGGDRIAYRSLNLAD
jgi:sugar lactone lactonase YvrE